MRGKINPIIKAIAFLFLSKKGRAASQRNLDSDDFFVREMEKVRLNVIVINCIAAVVTAANVILVLK